jgi:hypothetical protein
MLVNAEIILVVLVLFLGLFIKSINQKNQIEILTKKLENDGEKQI